VAVVGPNGAGKSTLLKAILGLVPLASGHVSVFGQPLSKQRLLVGYVPQRSSVDWNFPVNALDVVLMGTYGRLGWFRRPGTREKAWAMECLRRVGMNGLEKRQIGQLSGGQQQRVFLARALAQQALIYFMDEPMAGVDAATEQAIFAVLRGLRERGKTLLISSHLLAELEQICDWLVMIREGRPVFNGPSRELVSRQGRVLVEANDAGQLDIVAQIAASAGYQTERMHSLRVGCPVEWAPELGRRAAAAGAPNVQISTTRGSLEENVLAVLKGWSS
jgi:manganese/zinc/iron transport system ATP- binding protein